MASQLPAEVRAEAELAPGGAWSPEEEQKLVELVRRDGVGNWRMKMLELARPAAQPFRVIYGAHS